MRIVAAWVLGIGVAIVAACGSSGEAPSSGGGAGGSNEGADAGGSSGNAGSSDGGSKGSGDAATQGQGDAAAAPACVDGESTCVDHATVRMCKGGVFTNGPCGPSSGCVQGTCVPNACSDECSLGDTNGAKTCALYDVKKGAFTSGDPVGSTHDRTRAYEMWLRRDAMPFGGVGDAHYADPGTFAKVDQENDIGDSALFTGTLLAAEALRLKSTGAADAHAAILRIADTLHLFMNVAGEPGILARYALPSGAPKTFSIPDLDCTAARVHCNTTYAGASYDYIGDISRDQYQGVMLGYALAYEALGSEDEAARAKMRGDVVTFVKELMKDRQVPVHLTYGGIALPVSTITLRFVVLDPREMDGGAVNITIETSGSKNITMQGFQEFTPDLADIVRQFPGLGFAPSIPRASSAIMLASAFRVALMMTDGVAASKADHDAILAYYTGHTGTGGSANDWLAIAKQWSFTDNCGDGYYANNITMEPMYDLARLEDDPSRKATVQGDILDGKMWPAFSTTKNPFFSFIYAANVTGADPGAASSAADQIAQFVPPPNVQRAVDLRASTKYPLHSSSCTDQVDHSTAVDVGDRVPGDFMWQRAPWALYDPGNPAQTEPGVDFLIAYWMGRAHGFVQDDTPNACLVWK